MPEIGVMVMETWFQKLDEARLKKKKAIRKKKKKPLMKHQEN